jgi:hypothetical protein
MKAHLTLKIIIGCTQMQDLADTVFESKKSFKKLSILPYCIRASVIITEGREPLIDIKRWLTKSFETKHCFLQASAESQMIQKKESS